MKACWKEDAQAVASEPQEETVIESVVQRNGVFGLKSRVREFCREPPICSFWGVSQSFSSIAEPQVGISKSL